MKRIYFLFFAGILAALLVLNCNREKKQPETVRQNWTHFVRTAGHGLSLKNVDATIKDAEYAGIDKLAIVIAGDEGQEYSAPGIVLSYATKELLEKLENVDVVISKGQGNYESLSDINREIFFMLVVKCPLVARDIGREMAKLILKVKE